MTEQFIKEAIKTSEGMYWSVGNVLRKEIRIQSSYSINK
jgi:hypothetical protein